MWSWLLERYARFVLRRPWWAVGVAFALSVAAVALLPRLRIVTSRTTNLVSEDNPVQARILRFLREFGWHHNLVGIVQADTPERARAFADRLAEALRRESDVVRSVFHKLDLAAIQDKALLYVPVEELRALYAVLKSPALRVDEFARVRDLPQLFDLMERNLGRALRGEAFGVPVGTVDGAKPTLKVLAAFFEEIAGWVGDPARRRLEVLERLYLRRFARERSSFDEKGYLAGKDGRTVVLFVHPVKEEDSAEAAIPFTERVRAVVAREKAAFGGGVDVGVTGMPANIADEMSTIQRDMTVISLAAFFGIALLFLVAFRFSFRILLALLPILIGTLWTFGFASAAVGHLSLLTSVFSAVLFGLGDDFGIHLMSRFEEEWSRHGDAREAIATSIRETGPGVITGALTTAIAFYTTLIVEVDAFGELGLIAGTGLLLVMVAAFLVLPPAFLLWARLRARSPRLSDVPAASSGKVFTRVLGRGLLRYPVVILVLGGLATAFFLYRSPGIPFDYNLLRLLPPGSESVRYHYKLIESSNFSTEFNAVFAETLAEVQAKTRRLATLRTVGRVESVAPLIPQEADPKLLARKPTSRQEALEAFVPPHQPEKLDILRQLAPLFKDLPARYAQIPPLDRERIVGAVQRLSDRFDELLETAPPALVKPIARVVTGLSRLRQALRAGGDAAVARVDAFQKEMFRRLNDGLVFFQKALQNSAPITTADIAKTGGALLNRLVGKSGQYAIYAFPSGPIWNRDFLGAFVRDTKQVDAEATGFPVNYYFFSERIQSGFRWASLYAAIAIFILLLIEFRSVVYAVFAAVPVFIGATWMLGLMGLLGLEYNPANIVALPLILGMGVEYGVEIVHRFAEAEGPHLEGLLGTTARAVTIAGLTTMIGLGSLGLASHRGLASLGLILVAGIGACLLTSVLILPSILKLFARWRATRGVGENA